MVSPKARYRLATSCHLQNLSLLKLRRQNLILQPKPLQVLLFAESMRCARTGEKKERADMVTSVFLHMATMNYLVGSP